jgi:hypothetical protein
MTKTTLTKTLRAGLCSTPCKPLLFPLFFFPILLDISFFFSPLSSPCSVFLFFFFTPFRPFFNTLRNIP